MSSDAQARYDRERARCLSGQSQEDTQTCLREAGAALQAARAHDLTREDKSQLQANALKRCDTFKNEDDHRACVARITQGSTSGSVGGGGVLREYTEVVPGKPAAPAAVDTLPTPATPAVLPPAADSPPGPSPAPGPAGGH